MLDIWEYISGNLLNLMGMDYAYLQAHIPILPTIRQSMLAVGWALLIGNLVFQAAKSMMSGLGFEAEDPKLLFTRTFVFSFLLVASPQICDLCLNMTSTVIDIVELPNAADIQLIQDSAFDGLACAWLLVFICGVIVMFQSFRLIFAIAERYFILAVLTITAPLAFGMGGSRNTSDIFTGWCRMYGSMCLLMVLNVVFVKMLLSVLSTVPTGFAVLPWIVLVMTIVKVAKRADAIIARIGLNPAIASDSLGHALPGMLTYIATRTAMSQVAKAIGKNTGKDGGRSPNAPAGGNPKSGGPQGGVAAKGLRRATGSTERKQQGPDRQTASQNSSTQRSSAQSGQRGKPANSPVTVIPDDAEIASIDGNTPVHGAAMPTKSADNGGRRAGRQSSVPQGTVRSPSLVRQGGAAATASKRVSATFSPATSSSRNTSKQDFQQAPASIIGVNTHSAPPGETQGRKTDGGIREASANGTAGSATAASRFTHVPKHARGGVEPSKTVHSITERASSPAAASAEQQMGQTRMIRREAVESTAKRQTQITAQQESSVSSQIYSAGKGEARPMRAGTAGMDAPISTHQTPTGERHGRNNLTSASGVEFSKQPSSPNPAQQERAASPMAAAADKGQSSVFRIGMAGRDVPTETRLSTKGERPGRNTSPSSVNPSISVGASAPAWQENRPQAHAAPQISGASVSSASGTAGMAIAGVESGRTRRTAQKYAQPPGNPHALQAGTDIKPIPTLGNTNVKRDTRKSALKKEGRRKHGK